MSVTNSLRFDYSRQNMFVNPNKFKGMTCSIIGCGATGSHAAVLLAQSGFGNEAMGHGKLQVFDFDVVEDHNRPNQAFHCSHVGMNKAEALKDLIKAKSGFDIEAYPIRVTDQDIVQADYVFLLVDSMAARREIAESILKTSTGTKLVIETRMGLVNGEVNMFAPNDPKSYDQWLKSLFDDDDAEVSACGTSMSVAVTAVTFAALAVSRMIQDIDWTVGEHYLEKKGFQNRTHQSVQISLFPEMVC